VSTFLPPPPLPRIHACSDCGAISDIPDTHHYLNTSDQVLAAVFTAGTDIGCDGYIPPALPGALADGAITQAQVNTAMSHMFRVRMRLGQFDPYEQQPMRQWGPDMVCTNDSIALALDAAQQVGWGGGEVAGVARGVRARPARIIP
jgi:beta-glucosidase-like glycosyl hydrolase